MAKRRKSIVEPTEEKSESREPVELVVRCAHTELVSIDDVQPHPRNPNRHTRRQIKLLAKLLSHQGWRSPVVISKLSGYVIAGHARIAAAKMLGVQSVPVDYQEFSNADDEHAHLVADNAIAELAELDTDVIDSIVTELGQDFDRELLGMVQTDVADKTDDDADDDDDSTLEPRFQVVVDCSTEKQQSALYERLKKENFQCRVLTF